MVLMALARRWALSFAKASQSKVCMAILLPFLFNYLRLGSPLRADGFAGNVPLDVEKREASVAG
jgi:hypothetical protein